MPASTTLQSPELVRKFTGGAPRPAAPHSAASQSGAPEMSSGEVTPEFCSRLFAWLASGKQVSKECAFALCTNASALLAAQPTLVELEVPKSSRLTVVGDIHGKYMEMLQIFELNGMPSGTSMYIFNGDFVDRGPQSVETVLALFALKICYPQLVHLTRGNHEIRYVNMYYAFDDEVQKKYCAELYDVIAEAFCQLPLAYLLNKETLVLHGGLFHENGVTLEDIRKVDRRREPPKQGLMTDLLWSDPHGGPGRTDNHRGFGIGFGEDVTADFLKTNGLKMIIRSHEEKVQGYDVEHGGTLVTVFSSPDYCGRGNKGAYVCLDGDTLTPKFTTFSAIPKKVVAPQVNPNYRKG